MRFCALKNNHCRIIGKRKYSNILLCCDFIRLAFGQMRIRMPFQPAGSFEAAGKFSIPVFRDIRLVDQPQTGDFTGHVPPPFRHAGVCGRQTHSSRTLRGFPYP